MNKLIATIALTAVCTSSFAGIQATDRCNALRSMPEVNNHVQFNYGACRQNATITKTIDPGSHTVHLKVTATQQDPFFCPQVTDSITIDHCDSQTGALSGSVTTHQHTRPLTTSSINNNNMALTYNYVSNVAVKAQF